MSSLRYRGMQHTLYFFGGVLHSPQEVLLRERLPTGRERGAEEMVHMSEISIPMKTRTDEVCARNGANRAHLAVESTHDVED